MISRLILILIALMMVMSVQAREIKTIRDCLEGHYGTLSNEHERVLNLKGIDIWASEGERILTTKDTLFAITHLHEIDERFVGKLWWYADEGNIFVFVQRRFDDNQYPHGVCMMRVVL